MMRRETTSMMWALVGMMVCLAGCPPTNNQENNADPMPDMETSSEDMGMLPEDMGEQVEPDMGMAPADMDAPVDMSEPEDMEAPSIAATCFVEHISPGTLPIGAESASLTWSVSCNAPLTKEQVGERLEVARQRGEASSQAIVVEAVTCDEREDAWGCDITTSGVSTPPEPYEQAVGPEAISFEDTTGQRFSGVVHWHIGNAQLSSIQSDFDDVPLPMGYAERGLGVQKIAVDSGFLVFGAMESSGGDGIEIFDIDLESASPSVRVHETVSVSLGSITESDFQVRLVDNAVQVIWWGFDSATGQFTGKLTSFGQDASFQSSAELDLNAYTGPKLTRILDTQLGTQLTSTGEQLGVRVVAVTENNTIAVVRVFAEDSSNQVVLERQLDALGGVLPADLDETRFGILGAPGSLPDLDAEVGRSWLASSGGIDWISLDGITFASRTELQVQWPFTLDIAQTQQGDLVALTGSDSAEGSLFVIDVNDDGKPTSAAPLQMPPGVDFSQGGLAGARIEADTLTMFGRWPWNWRDKLKVVGQPDGSLMVTQWNLKPVAAGTPYALTAVRPLTVADSANLGASGEMSLQSITEDGALRTIPLSAIDGDCVEVESCAVRISNTTSGGLSMMLVPGVGGATMAIDKYGDILIDGVPLEFDLIGNPWIFNKPGDMGGAIAIATINHDMATHVVWDIGDDGSISNPGLLNFVTKDGSTTFDGNAVITGGGLASGGEGDTEGALSLDYEGLAFKYDAKGEPAGTTPITGALPMAQVLAATTSRAPVTVDLANHPVTALADGDAVTILSPASLAPFASNTLAEDAGSAGDDKILATLTEEQAKLPLEVRITGGKVQVFTRDGNGTSTLLEETEAATIAAENPTFVGSDGASTNVLSKTGSPRFTGKIKRIRIKKKRVGSGFKIKGPASLEENIEGTEVVYEVVLETRDVAPAGSLGERALIRDIGDFNGDGIEDVVVSTGARDDADLSGENSTIYFGDGLSGYSLAPYPLTGGPTVSWPPVQEAVAGNGLGTRKASAQAQQIMVALL